MRTYNDIIRDAAVEKLFEYWKVICPYGVLAPQSYLCFSLSGEVLQRTDWAQFARLRPCFRFDIDDTPFDLELANYIVSSWCQLIEAPVIPVRMMPREWSDRAPGSDWLGLADHLLNEDGVWSAFATAISLNSDVFNNPGYRRYQQVDTFNGNKLTAWAILGHEMGHIRVQGHNNDFAQEVARAKLFVDSLVA